MIMGRGPSLRSWITAAIVGGGLAWFLDPNSGARRRNITRDKLRSLLRRGTREAERRVGYARGQAYGIVQERVPHRRDNPDPDDVTLRDRVESEVFRDRRIPKGQINVNVADGVVELRGELPSQGDIDYVVERVRQVPDVREIHNYLHLPGTPAPNKEEALRVSK
jgi:osmotically-inducible protein OsmY